ncbi:MAG: GPW/gp25 family protein [Bacteroidales bacterium]|jgi:phage baseplate assembly protein W|nr:GPW/gp25 family protein [Bacteroidales bacterium]
MNYSLPLDMSRLFSESEGNLEQCSEPESIDRYLAAILSTHRGEHSFNSEFGTGLWEMDFENVVSESVWVERFTEYVKKGIQENEKRLKDVEIKIVVRDMVREDTSVRNLSIRKRVDVFIRGTVISTGKQIDFKHILYVGPLSRD